MSYKKTNVPANNTIDASIKRQQTVGMPYETTA